MILDSVRQNEARRFGRAVVAISTEIWVPLLVAVAYLVSASQRLEQIRKVTGDHPFDGNLDIHPFDVRVPWLLLTLLLLPLIFLGRWLLHRYLRPALRGLLSTPDMPSTEVSVEQMLDRVGFTLVATNGLIWVVWEIFWRSVAAYRHWPEGPPPWPEVPCVVGMLAAIHAIVRLSSYRVGWRMLTSFGGVPYVPGKRIWERLAYFYGFTRTFPVIVAVVYTWWLTTHTHGAELTILGNMLHGPPRIAPVALSGVPQWVCIGILFLIVLIELFGRFFNDRFLYHLAMTALERTSVASGAHSGQDRQDTGRHGVAKRILRFFISLPGEWARAIFDVLSPEPLSSSMLAQVMRWEHHCAGASIILMRENLETVDVTLRSLPPTPLIESAITALKRGRRESDILSMMHQRMYDDTVELQQVWNWHERQETFDLLETINDVVTGSANVEVSAPRRRFMLRGHRESIRIAIRALLENAELANLGERRESSAPGVPLTTRVGISVEENPRRISLVITDQGPGVPDRIHKRFFEPGNSGYPRPFKYRGRLVGMGMGLFWVALVAKAHNGQFWIVNNALDRGAVAHIELPAIEEGQWTSSIAVESGASSMAMSTTR